MNVFFWAFVFFNFFWIFFEKYFKRTIFDSFVQFYKCLSKIREKLKNKGKIKVLKYTVKIAQLGYWRSIVITLQAYYKNENKSNCRKPKLKEF